MNSVLFSKKSDNWATLTYIYNYYINRGYFDPCPLYSSFDGLSIDWHDRNFVNPPYSSINFWVDKCISECLKGKEVILLVPARTDTKWFRKLVDFGVYIVFITGRLHFNDLNSAPFPSCFVFFNTVLDTSCAWISTDDIFKGDFL